MSTESHPFAGVKYLFFDFMGTCLDWHTSITACFENLSSSSPTCHFESPQQQSELALAWRKGFFEEIHYRFKSELPQEDIDVTHRRVLDRLLDGQPKASGQNNINDRETVFRNVRLADEDRATAVKSWHQMAAWDDVAPALTKLKAMGIELFVLANGTTRLQLDLTKSSGLAQVIDMLFSSQLLQLTKPDPRMYQRAMDLVGSQSPDECVMVAAHAYDTRAARQLGMRTIYVHRWTEDQHLDMDVVKSENDFFIADNVGFGPMLSLLQQLKQTPQSAT